MFAERTNKLLRNIFAAGAYKLLRNIISEEPYKLLYDFFSKGPYKLLSNISDCDQHKTVSPLFFPLSPVRYSGEGRDRWFFLTRGNMGHSTDLYIMFKLYLYQCTMYIQEGSHISDSVADYCTCKIHTFE